VIAIIEEIRRRLPKSQILVLGIFPAGEHPDGPQRQTALQANRLIQNHADGKKVHYLDLGDTFTKEDGTISEEIMPDFLHLSAAGYRLWAEAMESTLVALLNGK
jgi:beta-glucosidase